MLQKTFHLIKILLLSDMIFLIWEKQPKVLLILLFDVEGRKVSILMSGSIDKARY
jgi:hypothetical protein